VWAARRMTRAVERPARSFGLLPAALARELASPQKARILPGSHQMPASDAFNSEQIAARLRGLIGGQDRGQLEATALRLGVSEVSLRMSIDEHAPHPTLAVLSAVVREYGVDPSWLIYGEYDVAVHRHALRAGHGVTPATILR